MQNFIKNTALVFTLAISISANAESVSVPYTFSSFQTSIYYQLNTDFAALMNGINDNDTRIDWLMPTVTSNGNRISSNTSKIYNNLIQINGLKSSVSTNTNNITSMQNSVDSNAGRLSSVEGELDNQNQRITQLESSGGVTTNTGESSLKLAGSVDVDGHTYDLYGFKFNASLVSARSRDGTYGDILMIDKVDVFLNPLDFTRELFDMILSPPNNLQTQVSLFVDLVESSTGLQASFDFGQAMLTNISVVLPHKSGQPNLLKMSFDVRRSISINFNTSSGSLYLSYDESNNSLDTNCENLIYEAQYMAPVLQSSSPGGNTFPVSDFTMDVNVGPEKTPLTLSGAVTNTTLCMIGAMIINTSLQQTVNIYDGNIRLMQYIVNPVQVKNYAIDIEPYGTSSQSLTFDTSRATVTVQ